MVYSPFGVVVDGVSLDSYAWNVSAKVRAWPGVRNGDVVLPGVDGVSQSLNDDLAPTTYTLTMWAIGTNAQGLVPPTSNAMAQVRANLDQLAFLFGKRHQLLNVVETVDLQGTTRQAWCKVVDAVSPEVTPGGVARFAVSLQVGEGLWQDQATADWSQAGVEAGVGYEVTTLRGSTGPIADGTLLLTGPAVNPQLNDYASGAYCRLNRSLAAGETWRVNSGTWATRYGSGLTLASPDSVGTQADAITEFGGGNARYLRMLPYLSAGERRVIVYVSGSGFTAQTSLGVRARRKFLQ